MPTLQALFAAQLARRVWTETAAGRLAAHVRTLRRTRLDAGRTRLSARLGAGGMFTRHSAPLRAGRTVLGRVARRVAALVSAHELAFARPNARTALGRAAAPAATAVNTRAHALVSARERVPTLGPAHRALSLEATQVNLVSTRQLALANARLAARRVGAVDRNRAGLLARQRDCVPARESVLDWLAAIAARLRAAQLWARMAAPVDQARAQLATIGTAVLSVVWMAHSWTLVSALLLRSARLLASAVARHIVGILHFNHLAVIAAAQRQCRAQLPRSLLCADIADIVRTRSKHLPRTPVVE